MNKEMYDKTVRFVSENKYMRDFGLEILDIDTGYAKGRAAVTDGILNPYGSVHGGVLYALADLVSGIAACTYGNFASTVNGNVNYLKPAMNTDYIYCEASVVRNGRKVSVYDIKITDDSDSVLETGTFIFYMMDSKV